MDLSRAATILAISRAIASAAADSPTGLCAR
jgi:hypothetical protein